MVLSLSAHGESPRMLDYLVDLLDRPFELTVAEEDAFFGMFCQAASHGAYDSFIKKNLPILHDRYFPRYPELSLALVLEFPETNARFDAEHLVKVWPDEHLGQDTLKLLSADRKIARRIGVVFGLHWMAQDPEASWLTLLTRYPQHEYWWFRELPFEQLMELAAGDAAQIERGIDTIPDPRIRRLTHERFKAFLISRMPFEEGLLELFTIRDKYVRSTAFFNLTEIYIKNESKNMDFLLALREEIGAENASMDRKFDRFLVTFANRTYRSRPSYHARLLELLKAIRRPKWRLKAMPGLLYSASYAPHPTEELIDYLATFPPGSLRHEVTRKMTLRLSPEEALAMARQTEEAWLRTILLDRVAAKGGPPEELAAEYQSARSATGSSKEGDEWRMHLKELLAAEAHVAALRLAVQRMDPEDPAFAPLFEPALAASPGAVAGHCLLVEKPDLRRSWLSRAVAAWATEDLEAAMAWCAALPGGADRVTAVAALASDTDRKADERVEALAWQTFLETGSGWLDDPGRNEVFTMYTFGQRWHQLDRVRTSSRAFAVLDEASVARKIADMPEGEAREMGQLGLYEHALARGWQEWIDAFGPALRASKNARVRRLAVMARIHALPEDGLADALAMVEAMDAPEARYVAKLAVVRRWHGAPYQAEIQSMLSGHPDFGQGMKMAEQWLGQGTQDAGAMTERLGARASELLERQRHIQQRISQLARMPLPSMEPDPVN